MSDITASERRLSAALDRMDQLLDARRGPSGPQSDRIAALERERDAALAHAEAAAGSGVGGADGAALAELQARLDAATEEGAALSAANEALIAANRDLLEAQQTGGIGPDEARAALEAELSALRAARAAEMAQMSEIMAELERLLADEPAVIDGQQPGTAGIEASPGGDLEAGSGTAPDPEAASGGAHGAGPEPDASSGAPSVAPSPVPSDDAPSETPSGAGRPASVLPTPQHEDR